MTPPPRPFRLVYRAFDSVEFDEVKSAEIMDLRGFDLGYISRIFPGYVLERQHTRAYTEVRYQVIGELMGQVYEVIYTRRGKACRIITAWYAEGYRLELWNDQFT